MKQKYVLYAKEGNVATVTLNKPEKLNAFQFVGRGEDIAEFYDALDAAEEDDDIKVIIIKGAGRAFSVGHDLTKVGFVYGMGTGKPGEKRPGQRTRLRLDKKDWDDHRRQLTNTKLMIAQVHGYCLGGGLSVALFCDYIIASEDAMLGFPQERLGFSGRCGSATAIVVYSVGLRRFLDLGLTGRLITGKEAEQWGLVNKAVPADKLEEEVGKLAQAFCLLPKDGIAIGKAHRHMLYETLGILPSFAQGYITHTLFTNLVWDEGEYNFFKERRDKGARAGFHGRDDRYVGLV